MAYSLGDIVVKLKANTADLERGLDQAMSKSNTFGNKLAGVGKVVAAGLAVGAAAATAFGVVSVKAYSESEDKLAQLNAVLKSTGGVAGWTADQAVELSKSLQEVTKFSDEDVLSVENLLLTFTKIGKDIMPQATETVLNMATALGEDTKSASIQLGKALQDPILGVTALRRVGVNFSEDQKKVIENLVNTGRSAEAQQMILKELNTEFGNSARAAGDTFSGKLAKLKNSLNDVQETLGMTIVKYLAPFATKALEAVNSINWDAILKNTIEWLKQLWDWLGKVYQSFDKVYQQVANYLRPKLKELGDSISDLFSVFSTFTNDYVKPLAETLAIITGKSLVWAIGETIDALSLLLRAITNVIGYFPDVSRAVSGFFRSLGDNSLIIIIVQYFEQVLLPILKDIWSLFTQQLWPAIERLWQSFQRLYQSLEPGLTTALKFIGIILGGVLLAGVLLIIGATDVFIRVIGGLTDAMGLLIGWVSNVIGWIGNLVGAFWNAEKIIVNVLWHLPQAINDMLAIVWSLIAGLGSMALRAAGDLGSVLYKAGVSIITGFFNGIKDKFEQVKSYISGIGKWIQDHKGPLDYDKKLLVNNGKAIIEGLNKGLMSEFMNTQKLVGNMGLSLTTQFAGGTQQPVVNNTTSTTITGPINIGNTQDADYLLGKMDRNMTLESFGISPS